MITLTIGDIEIFVEKKRIKNMYLRVISPDGKVRITAPMSATEKIIRMFATSRISWIKKQQQKLADRPTQTQLQHVSGENHFLWGKLYPLEIIYRNTQNFVLIGCNKIILQVSKDSTTEQRADIMNNWYREILKKAITPLFEKYKELIGVTPKEWRIKNMHTRWGTCSIKAKRIWINLQLVKKTPECLEYVIIHELVHLLEKKHNDVFKAYMDKFYPNWRIVKARLNEH